MADQTRPSRLAVLIDADNAPPRIATGLLEEIAKIGEASVRRIYGDFSGTRLKGWRDLIHEHGLIPQMNVAATRGKNASDIALVIDAMDLLHAGRVDGFCLVSSDGDFTRLAARIREQGAAIYGFGEEKTPKSFVNACQRFIYLENIMGEPDPPTPVKGKTAKDDAAAPPRRQPSAAVPLLRKAIEGLEEDDGWYALGVVGQHVFNLASDFDPRTYGSAKLSDLVKKTGMFDVKQIDRRLMIRYRNTKA